MPMTYTGNPAAVQAPDTGADFGRAPVLNLPIDGVDPANVSSIYQPLKVMADYIAMLNQSNWLDWRNYKPSDDNGWLGVEAAVGWNGIAYRPGPMTDRRLVAQAYNKVHSSRDGLTWAPVVSLPVGFIGTVAPVARPAIYSPLAGLFILGGAFATAAGTEFITSPDGDVWTARTDPGTTAERRSFAENGSIIVAARSTGGFATSPDGITWTTRVHPVADKSVVDVAWSPALSLFCAITNTGSRLTSPDGITWTDRGNPNAIANLSSIVWSAHHGVFVVQNYATGATERSVDGITWTVGGSTASGWYFGGRNMVADGPAIYSAGSTLARSLNGGVSWEVTNAPGVSLWMGIEKIDGRLCVYGADGNQKPQFAMTVKLLP